MKILYLCPDLGIPVLGHKGASVHVRELTGAFKRAGHRITLAAQLLNKSPWETPAAFDMPLLQIRPTVGASGAVQAFKEFNETLGAENSLPGELRRILYNKELAEDLKRRFENDPPDFIYERASIFATAGISLARHFKVPHILELNAPLAQEQSVYRTTGFGDLAAQAERWTLNQTDAVLVVSSELRKHVLSLGVRPERIHIVPNGVDPAQFKPAKPDSKLRRKWKLNGAPVLGFVGGLRPWHGVEILPDLLARLNKSKRPIQLVIAGDGQLRSGLERQFKQRELLDHITFTGALPHEQLPGIIQQFDIALAPYPKHTHDFYFSPLKLFEYMACGIPVVAANLGQITEVISDGKTGLLYEPGQLDALANRCEKLLGDSRLRARIGAAAAAVIRREFTWDKNAARVAELAGRLKSERAKSSCA
jgi:glycosyltransferase involved in cell wall biosynthesis